MRIRHVMLRAGGLVLALVCGAFALVLGRNPAAVDWRTVRAVAMESDDWGLCGFVPSAGALDGLDRKALAPGPFPPVYWQSTLEDSATVAQLAGVLKRHRGRDGLPAVLQSNYILSSLTWEPTADRGDSTWQWQERDLPDLPPAYTRPGLWRAVQTAIASGALHPEFHGRYHYDPARRRELSLSTPVAREAAEREVTIFPHSERTWELGPWRSSAQLAGELDHGLVVFQDVFGMPPRSVIAPDYHWDDRCERLWVSRGIRVIQAKREQRNPAWNSRIGRILKVLDRTWARQVRRDRTYLDRNCLLEPVQSPDREATIRACTAAVHRAWRWGEPAIVETHRINFVHLDTTVVDRGLQSLDAMLTAIAPPGAGTAPIYLVDGEIGSLQRHGTSWRVVGREIVVRNYTHSRRLLVVPAVAMAAAGGAPAARVIGVGPGETRRLIP